MVYHMSAKVKLRAGARMMLRMGARVAKLKMEVEGHYILLAVNTQNNKDDVMPISPL